MQNNLKELRRRSDLTQIELAHKSGIPRSRIQLAEAGTLELRREELRAIKEAVMPELALLANELDTPVRSKESGAANEQIAAQRIGVKEPKHD